MIYKKIFSILFLLLFTGCNQTTSGNYKKLDLDFENRYKNAGFALIYNQSLDNIKELEPRSLNIYHKSLKKKSIIKITNPKNEKYIIE